MSGVVLRCPKCGTTQSHPGECDACYDAQVRYFCSSHSPGLWLDEPACKECGAQFGEAPRRQPAPPSPAAPSVPPRTTRWPGSRRSLPRGAEPPRPSPRWPPDPEVTPAKPSLEDFLARMFAKRRERTGYEEEEAPWGEPTPTVRLSRFSLRGCLVSFLLLVLMFLALFLGGTLLLLGGAF